jgi:hypothetical protein
LTARVLDLEGKLSDAQTILEVFRTSAVMPQPKVSVTSVLSQPKSRHFTWLTITNLCVYGAFCIWIDAASGSLPPLVGMALLFFPFVSGLWLGLRSDRTFFVKHLIAGSIVICFALGPFLFRDLIKGLLQLPRDAFLSAAALFIPGLLSASGSLMGRWIKRLRSGGTPAAATRIADQLLRVRPTSATRPNRLVPKLAGLLAAIAPLLTFLASVIGAYLAYLAAVAGRTLGK